MDEGGNSLIQTAQKFTHTQDWLPQMIWVGRGEVSGSRCGIWARQAKEWLLSHSGPDAIQTEIWVKALDGQQPLPKISS